jgi:hypothetical protein
MAISTIDGELLEAFAGSVSGSVCFPTTTATRRRVASTTA